MDFPCSSYCSPRGLQLQRGHAAAVFKDQLWVVGGRGELYQTYNLRFQNRRGDVWSSPDGQTWLQSTELTGDFQLQNFDAVDPGALAPWYARFGHTLDVLQATNHSGVLTELMVLAGGYTPDPDNDVWVTEDGNDWRFAGNANWTGRGWHESSVFLDRLFIIGGSPLTNDVWAGDIVQDASGFWSFVWEKMASGNEVPFSPRAGLAAAVIQRPLVQSEFNDTLFLMGGFGGWPEDDPRYNGMRCRNDVYKTKDGVAWSVVTESADWGARGWFDVATLSKVSDPYSDVTPSSQFRTFTGNGPRMWLAGGGYMGQNGNSIVSSMIGYVDMWFSTDGLTWHQVNYEEGSTGSNLYSSMEWALTEVDNIPTYLGKWGHRMLAWTADGDDGVKEPALYLIAGDAVEGGSFVSDVFVSTETLFCTAEGIVCGGIGTCVDFGCDCEGTSQGTGAGGDFCTADQTDSESAGAKNVPKGVPLVVAITTVAAAILSVSTSSLLSLSWPVRERQDL
ncbi:unnamed protein product [Ectocarpus fasciculatus]